jgi:hypothetical protein
MFDCYGKFNRPVDDWGSIGAISADSATVAMVRFIGAISADSAMARCSITNAPDHRM